MLPEGWTKEGHKQMNNLRYMHADGREQKNHPGKHEGAIKLADSIQMSGMLQTITFGDKHVITMDASMTEVALSDKNLHASGVTIVAAFLPKCR